MAVNHPKAHHPEPDHPASNHRESHHPQPIHPRVADLVRKLTPELHDDFEERAAIMEFDAQLSRDHAEALALLDVLGRHPEALSSVRAFQITRHGATRFLLGTTERMTEERLVALGYAVSVSADLEDVLTRHFDGLAVLHAARNPPD